MSGPTSRMPRDRRVALRRLKLVAVVVPFLFLAAVELLRRVLLPDLFAAWFGYPLLALIVLLGIGAFASLIFRRIGRMQEELADQYAELLALHEAGLSITRELELEPVLQTVVDQARELVGARYGALALLHETGGMAAFLTSGITAEERERLGPIPEGHGILGVVLETGQPLRLDDLTADPRSVGFPPYHPVMRSLVAVPILSHGRVLGGLYLTEKRDAPGFDSRDQERLERFATQTAIAIENARLHQQVRVLAIAEERDRIAREMHDSIAQVLGYVNTKAQAAQELLARQEPERAAVQISQLGQAAREAYADVRENILGLRSAVDGSRSLVDALRDYLERWQDQSGVAAALIVSPEPVPHLGISALAEVQLLRIVQEALTNVRKHAQATHVDVRLLKTDGMIEIQVADNGVGFAVDATGRSVFPRFGLSTMRERAESVGGTLDVVSTPGTGTTVTVRIPLNTPLVARKEPVDARAHR